MADDDRVIAQHGDVRLECDVETDEVHLFAESTDEHVLLKPDEVRWLAMIGMPEAWRAVRPERELWRPPAAEEGADAGGGPAPAARHPTDGPDGQGDLFTGAQEG